MRPEQTKETVLFISQGKPVKAITLAKVIRFISETVGPGENATIAPSIYISDPEPQRRAAVLKDRPGHRGNMRQAFIASPHWASLNPVVLALLFTCLAVRNPVRKSLLSKMLKASIVIGKLTVEIINCVP
ncbi:MAG: hypothetical protein WB952_08695 [Terriglobales bacterium]